jgi:hypothetical protein
MRSVAAPVFISQHFTAQFRFVAATYLTVANAADPVHPSSFPSPSADSDYSDSPRWQVLIFLRHVDCHSVVASSK